MKESSTKVTVLVASHNEARRIGQCLESLLKQDYQPLEIILVDDGSTDDTVRIASQLAGVRVLRLPHGGKAVALNHAAREATGGILLFLDGDMYFAPDYVRHLVEPILSGGETGTCHGTEFVANPDGVWSLCWQRLAGLPPDQRLVLGADQIAAGSEVFRAVKRDDFLRVGGFDNAGYQDDQTLAAKLKCKARFVPEARCHHYNVESLAEVFALGRWQGKTVASLHGAKAMVSYFPLLSLLVSIRIAWEHRYFPMFAYSLVVRTGIFLGIVKFLRSGGTSYGR